MSYSVQRMLFAAALSFSLVPAGSMAQTSKEQTLADVRQDLTVLFVEVQRLKRELSTTGSSAPSVGGNTAIDRIASIEGELQRLTGKIEELEFRIDRVVKDGTKRIANLEFRLVELEGGDVSKLGETSTLGGGAVPAAVTPAMPSVGSDTTNGTQLAVGEQADFDAASNALAAGDASTAAEAFGLFIQNYPGSPMEGQARLKRGDALEQSGDTREAARNYLDTYSMNPAGPNAPDALFRLGRALGKLGKVSEACVTLGEVPARHPGTRAASDAQAEMAALSCP